MSFREGWFHDGRGRPNTFRRRKRVNGPEIFRSAESNVIPFRL